MSPKIHDAAVEMGAQGYVDGARAERDRVAKALSNGRIDDPVTLAVEKAISQTDRSPGDAAWAAICAVRKALGLPFVAPERSKP